MYVFGQLFSGDARRTQQVRRVHDGFLRSYASASLVLHDRQC